MNNELKAFNRLSTILDILRQQCPWDKAQSIESLRYLTIEEVYELSEAILQEKPTEMCKELGDLFMHLVFYAKIAEDRNLFTLYDVIDSICDKLLSRHPHIALPNKEGQLQGGPQNPTPQWEKIKMKEGRHSILEGVPKSLPTLIKTIRIQEKISGICPDSPSPTATFAKMEEKYKELQASLAEESTQSTTNTSNDTTPLHLTEEKFGDLLFAIIQWGNSIGINADTALAKANEKFQCRITNIENTAHQDVPSLSDLTPEQMLTY